jgi:hypothetical protein
LRIRLEAESDRNREHDEVENGGAGGLAHEEARKGDRITRGEAPAATVLEGEIPVRRNRITRKPTQHDKSYAPHDSDGDHAFAKHSVPGFSLEDAKVLEQQGQLYKGSRERVCGGADVLNLEDGKAQGSDNDWLARRDAS